MFTEAHFLGACQRLVSEQVQDREAYQTYWQGRERADIFSRLTHAVNDDQIVELGAGYGGLAMGLYLEGFKRYIGLDRNPVCTMFCRDVFTGQDREFVFDGFGRTQDGAIKYPVSDGAADCVVAFDLFTRMGDYWLVQDNLSEIQRISNPLSVVLTTWYFSDVAGLIGNRIVYSKAVIKQLFFDLRAEIISESDRVGIDGHNQTTWISAWQG